MGSNTTDNEPPKNNLRENSGRAGKSSIAKSSRRPKAGKRNLWSRMKRFYYRGLKQYMSFGFLAMLLLSFIMWYIIKLGGTYTATVPFDINIGSSEIRVEAVVSGKGDRIFAYRYYRRKPLMVERTELETSPSVVDSGTYVITPYSLQNAISRQITELQIMSLGPIPEVR